MPKLFRLTLILGVVALMGLAPLAHAVQFARPGVSIEFDIDQKQAVATRRSIMKAMAVSKSLVAGMHLPFPGIGHVRADGKGRYSWVPVEFGPLAKAAN